VNPSQDSIEARTIHAESKMREPLNKKYAGEKRFIVPFSGLQPTNRLPK